MKRSLSIAAALITLVAFSPAHSLAGDSSPSTRSTVSAADADLSRARNTILRFESACLSHDEAGMAGAVTEDVIVEYALAEPGMYLALDKSALDKHCLSIVSAGSVEQVTDVLTFPTNRPNTVFAQYKTRPVNSTPNPVSRDHLALIELRDDRIARVREFTSLSNDLIDAATVSARNASP